MGGKFHPKLNMCLRPIVNKYHEGKLKRTLKRELKVCEIAEVEVKNAKLKLTRLLHGYSIICMHSASMCACAFSYVCSASCQISESALVSRQTVVDMPAIPWNCDCLQKRLGRGASLTT